MNSAKPLPIIAQPSEAGLAAYEIILVHGLATHFKKSSQAAECQRILETWVIKATESIRNKVNVRTFTFDGAHVLHHGRFALSQATIELSRAIGLMKEEASSPMFISDPDNGINNPPRVTIFIAHGIAAWVVKELLFLWRDPYNRVDPKALIFLDVPEIRQPSTPIDLLSESVLASYLKDFSKTFRTPLKRSKIDDLTEKMGAIDTCFKDLTGKRPSPCEDIAEVAGVVGTTEGEKENSGYVVKLWCSGIWMYPQLFRKFETSKLKQLIRGIRAFLRIGGKSEEQKLLEKIGWVGLEKKLKEAIGANEDVDDEDEDDDDADNLSDHRCSAQQSRLNKGKEKVTTRPGMLRARRSPSSTSSPPSLPPILENTQYEHLTEAGPSKVQGSKKTDIEDEDEKKFYDPDDAIAQRDKAAAADDDLGMASAICRLQLVKYHLQRELGPKHPKTLIIRRELLLTSLVDGTWCGKPITKGQDEEAQEMENEAREIFKGLEEVSGPLHRDTLEALLILLSVRVTLIENESLPKLAGQTTMNLLQEKLADPTVTTPETLPHTLRLKYKAAATFAQIDVRGDLELQELLAEIDMLLANAEKDYHELAKLRQDVLTKMDELHDWREMEHEKEAEKAK
ncbi:uncharacterized protein F4822DRAFT_426141 [Hypoxylon trugodes]|uniref:uncharacterized protein n=1 Tax=Hypoxylon trugodes TaxID=326681 RepID=UPI0021979A0B|nr:uncharacterized protein F4822DRAFT_426141 [Hypoxylon trugodes]KAI1392940.1 hypothetical protein F4822DRAFT_426141 [Hypoxylon trugodes]